MAKIQPHFDGKIKEQVSLSLSNAKYSIRVAMFSLNENSLFELLCRKAETDKIEVEVLLDLGQYEKNKERLHSPITRLENLGGSVFLYKNIEGDVSHMHNKFCIIDDKILITGSYNWTNNASKFNDENVVIIDDFVTTFEFGKKFNELKKKAKLYNDEAELPVYFTVSKNVVKRNEEVEVSWNVPNADTVIFNEEEVKNSDATKIIISENRKFRLFASNGNSTSVKTISVTIAEKPEVISFKLSEKVIRRGQSVRVSWEVKGANKVKIEPFGEVASIGTREHSPQTDTTYRLTAYDVWDEGSIKEESIRVPDFKVPSFEKVLISIPQIASVLTLEIKKPVFAQNINSQTSKKISENQAQFAKNRSEQIEDIKRNREVFDAQLKKSIEEKAIQVRSSKIRESIIDHTENILNHLLNKLKERR